MEDEHDFEEQDRPEDKIPPEEPEGETPPDRPGDEGRPGGLEGFSPKDMPDLGGPWSRDEPSDKPIEEKEVKVIGVYEHQDAATSQPAAFVLLRDNVGRSVLIWIGRPEAFAISVALEGASADRPMTHDLLKNIISRLGGTIDRIVIDDLWHDTYYAKIHIATNGSNIEIDSRPSDAIAIGLRAKAPIYMAEAVLEQAAVYEE